MILHNDSRVTLVPNRDRADAEIFDSLVEAGEVYDPALCATDREAVVDEYRAHLDGTRSSTVQDYLSYAQIEVDLRSLAGRYPSRCQVVSLAKTDEGRDVLALHVSGDLEQAGERPGVVITGGHHAREWVSVEVPRFVAHQLLEGYATDEAMRARVDGSDLWIVPVVNPDGYEYSRNQDNWWRKNRAVVPPLAVDGSDLSLGAIGVDLNRNYWDGTEENWHLYRPDGDTPGSTWDDFGVTSDSPRADTFRGRDRDTEPEVKALIALEKRPNMVGVLDHHAYGEMILYPWGCAKQPVENQAEYLAVGEKMRQAQGGQAYSLRQGISLYPASGTSKDCQKAMGVLGFTLELSRSFQPRKTEVERTCRVAGAANMAFLDEMIHYAEAR